MSKPAVTPNKRRAGAASARSKPEPLSREALLLKLRAIRPELSARYHIRSLGLFGSYGRGTPSRRSDVDILVSFSETPGLFTFVRLKSEMERCLGRRVDLVMREALRPAIGRRILSEVSEI